MRASLYRVVTLLLLELYILDPVSMKLRCLNRSCHSCRYVAGYLRNPVPR